MEPSETHAHDFKAADATSYDGHVADFERFTAALTAPLAAQLISMAGICAGQRVLDVGTGTGIVAIEAARSAGLGGGCVGIDLSQQMLACAKANADRAGLGDRLVFQAMDAESLQFEAARFDVVVSLFALLHFPNPAAALKEMFRVLRPGGTLVVGVGSAPRWASLQGIAHVPRLVLNLVARHGGRQLVAPEFLDHLVKGIIPAPPEPEQASLAHGGHDRPRGLAQLIAGAGFESSSSHWEGHQAVLKTAADFWDIQRTFSSLARKRLNSASPEQVARVKAAFDQGCQQVLARGGRLTYPFAAFFVAARRPVQP